MCCGQRPRAYCCVGAGRGCGRQSVSRKDCTPAADIRFLALHYSLLVLHLQPNCTRVAAHEACTRVFSRPVHVCTRPRTLAPVGRGLPQPEELAAAGRLPQRKRTLQARRGHPALIPPVPAPNPTGEAWRARTTIQTSSPWVAWRESYLRRARDRSIISGLSVWTATIVPATPYSHAHNVPAPV